MHFYYYLNLILKDCLDWILMLIFLTHSFFHYWYYFLTAHFSYFCFLILSLSLASFVDFMLFLYVVWDFLLILYDGALLSHNYHKLLLVLATISQIFYSWKTYPLSVHLIVLYIHLLLFSWLCLGIILRFCWRKLV